MKRVIEFFQRINLRQVLSIFVVGAVLVLTTACNNGDAVGARPNNPPVQMGGNNNSHTMGGDGYGEYKASTDPKVNRQTGNQRSDVPGNFPMMAQNMPSGIEPSNEGIQYPGAGKSDDSAYRVRNQEDQPLVGSGQKTLNQRDGSGSNLLERVGKQFEEASEFVKDDADSAGRKAIANEKAKTEGSYGNDTIFEKSY